MNSKVLMLMTCVAIVSLLVLSGCKGKSEIGSAEVDLTTPPPLPEESAAEGAEGGEQPPAPPSSGEQQPARLPLLG